MLNGLDLFSGIGGISLALKEWVRPVAYCENDKYAQAVLLSRMWNGQLFRAPIWDDVRTLSAEHLQGFDIDIIYGGFPCQDISVAGHGRGLEGKRSGLYWSMYRLIREFNPTFVFLENVPAIRTRGLKDVVGSLTDVGYDCRWTRISAAEVGANHIRYRWFLFAANANSKALREQQGRGKRSSGSRAPFNSSDGDERPVTESPTRTFEPRVSRTGNGIPFAVDRDRALGNAVVPAQAREAFKRLCGITPPPQERRESENRTK